MLPPPFQGEGCVFFRACVFLESSLRTTPNKADLFWETLLCLCQNTHANLHQDQALLVGRMWTLQKGAAFLGKVGIAHQHRWDLQADFGLSFGFCLGFQSEKGAPKWIWSPKMDLAVKGPSKSQSLFCARSLLSGALASTGDGWFCNDRYHKQMAKGAADVCVEVRRPTKLWPIFGVRECSGNSCTQGRLFSMLQRSFQR